ncbi:MAG: hypothetical protein ACR2FE_11725 [Aeromicrobium sp.]
MRVRLRAVLILTALLAGGAVVLAFTVVPSTAQKQQVQDAGRVAEAYERDLEQSIDELGAYVVKRRFENATNYQKLYDQVTERMDTIPTIPKEGTTAYGRKHSREYRTAASRRSLELVQFERFTTFLQNRIIPRQEFVDAGVDLVQVNPRKLLEGFTVQFSGEALRTEVVPAYRKARKKLLDQKPAAEDAELARDLKRYADDTIKMTRGGADDIDAGRGFFFEFGNKPDLLLRRLEDTQRAIAAEVSTQVDAIDTSGGAPAGGSAV